MLLAIDVGNSTVNFGLFAGDSLSVTFRAETRERATPDEYWSFITSQMARSGVEPGEVKATVISSVVPPLLHVFFEALKGMGGQSPLLVSPRLKLGIKIVYRTPETLGSDRLAAASGAYALHGGPVIVLDFGTATTLTVVDAAGSLIGGAIAPGLFTGYDALTEQASGLHKAGLTFPKSAIGASTDEGLQSGIIFGHAGMVDGLVQRSREEIGANARVVATGGLSGYVVPHMKGPVEVEPSLTLKGLAAIYALNS